ncbi:ACLY, partial [Symbiodinium necroappetens]
MPIVIPNQGEDSRPVPKQVQCLENGTDLFKMFEVDMNKFDSSQVRKSYHKMATFVHPDKLGREPTDADRARFTKLKQAYTVLMDEQLRAVSSTQQGTDSTASALLVLEGVLRKALFQSSQERSVEDMSVKPIREHAGKSLLEKYLPEVSGGKHKMGCAGVLVTPAVLDSTGSQTWDSILQANPWLKTTNLVAKPDQLIKRRGKAGLIAVNKTFDEAKQWVMDRMCKEQQVEHVTGQLNHFLVEPFVLHKQEQEHYICMLSHRYHDEILFYHEGGVDVGDVDAKAEKLELPFGETLTEAIV